MKRIAVIVGLLSLLSASQALAAPPVDDSAQGVTCYFYSVASRLEWERRTPWDRTQFRFGIRMARNMFSANSVAA